MSFLERHRLSVVNLTNFANLLSLNYNQCFSLMNVYSFVSNLLGILLSLRFIKAPNRLIRKF